MGKRRSLSFSIVISYFLYPNYQRLPLLPPSQVLLAPLNITPIMSPVPTIDSITPNHNEIALSDLSESHKCTDNAPTQNFTGKWYPSVRLAGGPVSHGPSYDADVYLVMGKYSFDDNTHWVIKKPAEQPDHEVRTLGGCSDYLDNPYVPGGGGHIMHDFKKVNGEDEFSFLQWGKTSETPLPSGLTSVAAGSQGGGGKIGCDEEAGKSVSLCQSDRAIG